MRPDPDPFFLEIQNQIRGLYGWSEPDPVANLLNDQKSDLDPDSGGTFFAASLTDNQSYIGGSQAWPRGCCSCCCCCRGCCCCCCHTGQGQDNGLNQGSVYRSRFLVWSDLSPGPKSLFLSKLFLYLYL